MSVCVLYLISLNKWVGAPSCSYFPNQSDKHHHYSLWPNDLVRNLMLNYSVVSWYFISLEISPVSFHSFAFRGKKFNGCVRNDLAW